MQQKRGNRTEDEKNRSAESFAPKQQSKLSGGEEKTNDYPMWKKKDCPFRTAFVLQTAAEIAHGKMRPEGWHDSPKKGNSNGEKSPRSRCINRRVRANNRDKPAPAQRGPLGPTTVYGRQNSAGGYTSPLSTARKEQKNGE